MTGAVAPLLAGLDDPRPKHGATPRWRPSPPHRTRLSRR